MFSLLKVVGAFAKFEVGEQRNFSFARAAVLAIGFLFLLILLAPSTKAQNAGPPAGELFLAKTGYVEAQLIIKFKDRVEESQKRELRNILNSATLRELSLIGAELVQISGMTVEQAISLLKDDSRIQYVEPNFIWHADIIPNDPSFNLLWGMHNTGQTGGTVDADIDAVEAWDISTGDSVIIGVIDTGVDTAHVDLLGNIWTNPGEIPNNGIDDDGNGYVDDIHGWDFVNWDNGPVDDNGHGTHVSGTIAAVGNNAIGVAGVCWSAKIMPLKFLDSGGYGTTADAILAVEYASRMGANLTSNSWGGGSFSQALKDAIDSSGVHGMLFVAAAGNSWEDNDIYPHYPSSYDLDNIIAVAATDHNDSLADEPDWGSNWGLTSVDIGAPGVSIYSTIPGNSYTYLSGTSMATPHVSGAAAIIWSKYPALTHLQVKDRIMSMADPVPDLAGKCVTGGRLNAFMTIAEPDSIPPSPISDLSVITTGGSWAALSWTATGDDTSTGTAAYYDVRYSLSPIDSVNFNSATQAVGEPDPKPAGSPDTFVVSGLDFSTTLYFAIKAFDEWGNASGVSNSPWGTTLGPPDISVSPDSLSDSLFTGETAIETLTISNTGVSELTFDISITGPGGAAASVDFIADKSLRSAEIVATGKPVPLDQIEIMRTELQKVISLSSDNLIDKSEPSKKNISESSLPEKIAGVEIFGSMENVFFAGPRTRGNLFTCTNGTSLIEHRFYLNPSASTQLWFLVYEGNSQVGIYNLVSASNVSPAGPGEGWYSSGNINVPLVAGKYYLIVASFEQQSNYYNQQNISLYPIPASFGQLTAGAGWDWAPTSDFPPASIQDVPSYAFGSPVAYYQAIVTGVGTSWLSVNPDSGTIPVSSSMDITVNFNAVGLNGGDYDANIVISSNDPDEPEDTVSAHLHVTGAPDIAVDYDSLNFGIVYIGYPENLPLLVSNTGTDNLTVTGIVSDAAEFSVDLTSFVLAPGEDTVVNVIFAPTAVGEVLGNLTISSDDPDEPTLTVALRGEGLVCPNVWVDPASVSDSLFTGEASVETLTVGNSGGSPLYLKVELDNLVGPTLLKGASLRKAVALYQGSSFISELLSPRGDRKTSYDPNAKATAGLYEFGQDGFSNISATPGDVLASWPAPSPIQAAWGLGFDGNQVWISDAQGITDNKVTTAGVLLSWFSCSAWVGVWPGDMDWDGNYIWQVNVGGDNGIYKLDPANGNVLNSIHDPSHTWDAVSQRGLAYDRKTDVFYIGGWNQNRVYKIKGLSWNNPGEILSFFDFPNVSGLAWHPGGTLWIAVNASTDYIFQVNPETGSIISQFLAPGAGSGYEGAGLAIDKQGNLWCTSQSTHMVYLVESGVPAYQWLAVAPEACTLGVGETKGLEVRFDATDLFGGDYSADIIIKSNDCDQPVLTVPASLHVTGAPDIAVDHDSLNFGIVYIGYPENLPLLVSNKGTDNLTVTGIVSDVAEFSVDLTSFVLSPGKDTVVNVTFAPIGVGSVLGNLTISSNDPVDSLYQVLLIASGRECPDLAFSPDSLVDSLFTGGTTVDTLYLKNIGQDTLMFSFPDFAAAKLLRDPLIKKNDTENRFGYMEFGKDETDTRKGNPVTLGAGGPDSTGYTWIDSDEPGGPVFNYIDISGTGTLVTGLSDDNYVGPFPIGFSFEFYDSNHTQFYIQSNGTINFNNVYIGYSNQPIPQADGYNNLLAWCWDDLYGSTGQVYYQQMGNKLVIQFVGYGEFGGSGTVDAEVILYSDGRILYQYDNFNSGFDVLGSTVGIENAYGTDGLQVVFNAPYLHNDLAVLFSRGAMFITDVSPASGGIPSGDSLAIEVTLSAEGMYGGDYRDSLLISSNDCDTPDTSVPVLLHVTGVQDIAVSDDTLDFGSIFIGASAIETLIVSNVGTDTLTVSNISSNNSNYTVDKTSFILDPGQHQAVLVTLTPSLTGPISGNLTISSDDPDEPQVTVSLQGEGLIPPDISVSPDSFSVVVVAQDTVTDTLTISNTGGSDLTFNISVEEVTGLSIEKIKIRPLISHEPINDKSSKVPSSNPPADKPYDFGHSPLRGRINPNEIELKNKITGGLKILLLISGGDPSEIQTLLLSFPDISVVDIFDAYYSNPSLDQLTAYNSVIVMNNTAFGDPVGIGNVLADYVDAGGGVVLTIASFAIGWEIQGRFLNEDYMPFNLGYGPAGSASLGYFNPNHPIMKGVTSAFGDLLADVTLATGAELVAEWNNGFPFVATKGSSVAAVNIFVASPGYWTGDIPLILHNAAFWTRGIPWLSVNPLSGTVPASSSTKIAVTMIAPDTACVNYFADLVITSNDPDENPLNVPVHMKVIARGDVNADCNINVSDVVYLINYMFKGGPAPKALSSGDVNCDGKVLVADIVYLINYLFKGGPKPAC